jgi:uncharacterized protein YecT (DUF1311 family)
MGYLQHLTESHGMTLEPRSLKPFHITLALTAALLVAGCGQPKQPAKSVAVNTTIAPVQKTATTAGDTAPDETAKATDTNAVTPGASAGRATANAAASSAHDRCTDAADGSLQALRECAAAENGVQDAELNSTYKTLMAKLQQPQRDAVRAAQRSWIKFRDEKCAPETDSGTVGELEANSCMSLETERRTRELEKIPVR